MMNYRKIGVLARESAFYGKKQRFERLVWRVISKLTKSVRLKNYPLLACVPSDVIGRRIVAHGLYEEELLLRLFRLFHNFLPAFREQAAIDVGANIGNHSLFFSRYFKQVISFEPNPTALKLLETNIFLNKTKNICVIPIGLSNQSAVLPFIENDKNLGGSKFEFNFQKNKILKHQFPSISELKKEMICLYNRNSM